MVKKRYTAEFEGKVARGMLVNAPISTKWAREVAVTIKGMSIPEAKDFLNRVLKHQDWIPLRRYNKKVAHRKGVKAGIKSGRFLDKTVKYFLRLIRNVEANAEAQGIDSSRARIVHVWVGKGFRRWKRQPKGRFRLRRAKSTHVEMVVKE
ncbi:MAG: 50S ribosomal protein L22 [Candidatus Diapherotrites archaeon]|nr:50S ribosomal protein L22 [Candidatus Diapherotrites archaeon]